MPLPFTRSRQHSQHNSTSDSSSQQKQPSSPGSSSAHTHNAAHARSSSPTVSVSISHRNHQPGPLRPEMTPPNPPHRHTTRSSGATSAKESLMSVLGPSSGKLGKMNGNGNVNVYDQEDDDMEVPDLVGGHAQRMVNGKPGLTSNASFITTSTASTVKVMTPPSDDTPLPYPYLSNKQTVQGFSSPQYKYSAHQNSSGMGPDILERQATLLHSKFDGLQNGTSSQTSGQQQHHHYNTHSQISSVLPDDLSPILEKPLMLGHGPKGGYGFPNTAGSANGGPWGTNKSGNRHSEFGWDPNQNWRYTSQYDPNCKEPKEVEPTYFWLLTTYFSYLVLISLGHLRDFWGKRFNKKEFLHLMPQDGYAALMSDFDSFYTRRLKLRLDDCFSRPTAGVAGRTVTLLDRKSDDQHKSFQLTGTKTRALNISSYNYLGFAQATGGCADAVEAGIRKYGISAGGARLEAGTLDLHVQAEKLVSQFIGSEDAMIVSMGFATNSTTIPALVDRGCLVISDEFNHSSIRFGVRLSGASVRTFKHNDMKALDTLLRESISQGQPRTHRPWKKILVIVEGLYSMEGTMLHLPELIVMKERYKFYLYVDEAHSIGALGPNGRGVCDYFGVDPRCIDILMGTFTKSFGASGGYIAGNKDVIDRIRVKSHSMAYAEAITPPVLTQIISSMASIMGVSPPLTAASSSPVHKPTLALHPSSSDTDLPALQMAHEPGPAVYGPAPSHYLPPWMHLPPALLNGTEGRERLRRLAFNSRYLSSGLRKLGFVVSGHRDSPIVPLFLFHPGKMPVFSRMMLERVGKDRTPVVVVVVAYPATPLISSRVRFCLSAAHTKHDIDLILRACDEIGDILDLKTGKNRWSADEVIRRAEELVHEN